ncbi:MAG TPA: FAD-binding oxidoreductase, partial [Pseudomonadaceae bacterium]|nr:FAD-binding oxidoreductase [Pseudomonadaceae bacterium]
QLFIGSEGTLGVVTRAVLRLYPQPSSRCSALLAVADFPAVVKLLQHAQRNFAGALSVFEVMWQSYYHFITEHVPGVVSPFTATHPLYVLLEFEGADAERDQAHFEAVLAAAMEEGVVSDAVIAASGKDREGFWKIRDGVAEIGNFIRHVGNFDVSVPISSMPAFLREVEADLQAALPDLQMMVFGHVADSNLHFLCHTGRHEDIPLIHATVYAVVGRYQGSVSAEHGIGVQKSKVLHHSRSAEEIALMATLKAALDPQQILNRGRVLGGTP